LTGTRYEIFGNYIRTKKLARNFNKACISPQKSCKRYVCCKTKIVTSHGVGYKAMSPSDTWLREGGLKSDRKVSHII